METLADLLLVTVFDVGRSLEYIGEMTLRYLRSTNIDRIAGVFNLKKCYLKSVVECKTSFKNNQLFNENQSNTFLCFTKIMKKGKNIEFNAENQCLRFGYGSASVGSARFSLPKRIRIQGIKYQPKTVLLKNPKFDLLKKREIIKISSFLNGSSSFRIKICEKH